ncbi:hypothetical protein LOC54_09975 [Acetobacter sp. AN02]|uniref:hypothetical protein n=1 Tax=Acetobacter sp. AN02 TaxID=2894186 RepID=UPI0024340EEB|nr:hypothetical protein [Acetobacter sp. AN02]MDG6095424.1 hypothetical protein [Acetobacter sp. AN02]
MARLNERKHLSEMNPRKTSAILANMTLEKANKATQFLADPPAAPLPQQVASSRRSLL